jgi:hypothetical protein
MPSLLKLLNVGRKATKLMFCAVLTLSVSLTACESGMILDEIPQVNGAAFTGSSNLWVVTTDGKILRTLNGGLSGRS